MVRWVKSKIELLQSAKLNNKKIRYYFMFSISFLYPDIFPNLHFPSVISPFFPFNSEESLSSLRTFFECKKEG